MTTEDLETHYRKLEAMYSSAPINERIPCRVEISKAHAEVALEVSQDYWHAAGAMHGALYFKGLDDAAFFAANSVVPEAFVLTAKFEVDLLARVTSTSLRAIGQLESHEGRKIQASARLYVGDQLVARGRGLFIVSNTRLDSVPGYGAG